MKGVHLLILLLCITHFQFHEAEMFSPDQLQGDVSGHDGAWWKSNISEIRTDCKGGLMVKMSVNPIAGSKFVLLFWVLFCIVLAVLTPLR